MMKQRESGLPFDDFRNLVKSLPDANESAGTHTAEQFVENSPPANRVKSFCEWYSLWSGRSPVVHRPLMTLFCGTHQVTDKLDGSRDSDWLLESVSKVAEGGDVINRLCHQQDMGLKLFDLALQIPVADISQEAALDEKSCAGTIAFGMEAIAGGADLLAICAIENRLNVSVAAILSLMTGIDVAELVGSNAATPQFLDLTHQAMMRAKDHKSNPLEIMRRLGGRETAAICGAILAARTEHIPAVVGSYSGLAALVIMNALEPDAIAHCVFASKFENDALNSVLTRLGISVVLDAPISDVFGGDVCIATGILKSAFKHFPVADQATKS